MMMKISWGFLLLGLSAAVHGCAEISADTLVRGVEGTVIEGQYNLGLSVSPAGDVNGDGIEDLFISNYNSNFYIIWGRNASQWEGTATTPIVLPISASTDPSSYVTIKRLTGCSYFSESPISFGDINDDGFSDILIAGVNSNPTPIPCGSAIFGHDGAWDAQIDANTAPGLEFEIESTTRYTWTIPSDCGDINGDGIDDILVGTDRSVPFVVFGYNDTLIHRTISRSDLDGTNGFVLTGYPTGKDFSNGHMGRAGDVNGDGIEDLLIGARNAERAYVLFGRTEWTATVSVSDADMDGTHGFIVTQPLGNKQMAFTARGIGDINGDGYADIFLDTAYQYYGSCQLSSNMGFVIFGASTWGPTFSVADLDGTNGFKLQGDTTTCHFAYSGGPVGDYNGDGIDDFIISDDATDFSGVQSGAAWVLYGHVGEWPATITRSNITGPVGFEIAGPSSVDEFGYSATGAGDVNGDGLPDLVIGAPASNTVGYVYVIFNNAVEGCLECNKSGFCMHCAQGWGLEADGTCTECTQPNTWSVGTDVCQTCLMNDCEECEMLTGICTKCSAGMEPNIGAPVECDTCSSTQFSPNGTQCGSCLLGFGCISCNTINGLCVECPAGMHLDGTSCEDCGDMQWSAGGSAATCSACQVDATCEECDSRTGHCTSCPAAHGLADSGCTACGATQFSDGKHACAACELQDGCSACNRTTGMCVACPAGTGLQGVGCVACTPTRFVVNGYCAECALDDGCIACDPVTGACVDCPGDMVPTGTGCKPFEVASNATKDDDDNVSMAAKPTTNALHLIASIIVSAIAAAAMATF